MGTIYGKTMPKHYFFDRPANFAGTGDTAFFGNRPLPTAMPSKRRYGLIIEILLITP